MQAWLEGLDDPYVTPVVPKRLDDLSDSLPRYLVESTDTTAVVKSVIEEHGSEGMHAVLIDFGSGEPQFRECRKYVCTSFSQHFMYRIRYQNLIHRRTSVHQKY